MTEKTKKMTEASASVCLILATALRLKIQNAVVFTHVWCLVFFVRSKYFAKHIF